MGAMEPSTSPPATCSGLTATWLRAGAGRPHQRSSMRRCRARAASRTGPDPRCAVPIPHGACASMRLPSARRGPILLIEVAGTERATTNGPGGCDDAWEEIGLCARVHTGERRGESRGQRAQDQQAAGAPVRPDDFDGASQARREARQGCRRSRPQGGLAHAHERRRQQRRAAVRQPAYRHQRRHQHAAAVGQDQRRRQSHHRRQRPALQARHPQPQNQDHQGLWPDRPHRAADRAPVDPGHHARHRPAEGLRRRQGQREAAPQPGADGPP